MIYPLEDVGTFRKREDGQWRSDQAQRAHEAYLKKVQDELKRVAEIAALCRADPLLKRLDEHLDRGGVHAHNERYLIIGDILDLIARSSPPTS